MFENDHKNDIGDTGGSQEGDAPAPPMNCITKPHHPHNLGREDDTCYGLTFQESSIYKQRCILNTYNLLVSALWQFADGPLD